MSQSGAVGAEFAEAGDSADGDLSNALFSNEDLDEQYSTPVQTRSVVSGRTEAGEILEYPFADAVIGEEPMPTNEIAAAMPAAKPRENGSDGKARGLTIPRRFTAAGRCGCDRTYRRRD